MASWKDLVSEADENGVIPEAVYEKYVARFPICPPQEPEAKRRESEIWQSYLSSTRRLDKQSLMYKELYRYEWYEGRKRTGFWGNIETAIKQIDIGRSPKITIFSAGSGRDLLKVGLAAGIFESTADKKIVGTHKEIDAAYMRLAKPDARILMTEYDENNLSLLKDTVNRLINAGALMPEMVTIRRWNFRQTAPLVTGTQDLAVFSLTGNYSAIEEQPLMLREIARCIKPAGYLVAATMTDKLDFNKARSPLGKVRLIFTTPLALQVAWDFIPWQARWGKMAAKMYDHGYWENAAAEKWMSFLAPAQMENIAIYPGPSKFLPVEVLLARKKESFDI